MNIIKSNRKFDWVLTPYRETIVGRGTKNQIAKHAKTYQSEYINISEQKYVAFSNDQGQDLGMTLKAECQYQSYLYLEWINDGCVFIHIRNGELIEDRLIAKDESIIQTLQIITKRRDVRPDYSIETFAIPDNDELKMLLTNLLVENGSVVSLSASKIDTLEFQPRFSFQIIRDVERQLTDKSTQSYTLIVVVALVIAVGLFSLFQTEEIKERIVLKDNYSEYRQTVLNGQSASVMLAQDYNMHRLFSRELIGWKVFRVTYTAKTLRYSMVVDYGSPSTLHQLKEFTDKYKLDLVFDEEGTHVFSPTVKASPYVNTNDIRSYNLDLLVSNIIDNSNKVTPFIAFQIEQKKVMNAYWARREVVVRFKGAVDHDLLRLAAVLDGYPERYPVLIKESSSYQVDPSGVFSEGLKFDVVGDI